MAAQFSDNEFASLLDEMGDISELGFAMSGKVPSTSPGGTDDGGSRVSPLPVMSPSEPSLEKSEAGTEEAQRLEEIKVQVPPPPTPPQADLQEFNYDCPDYLKERLATRPCVYCPEKLHGKHSFCKVHRQRIEAAKYDKDHGEDGERDGPKKAEAFSMMNLTELLGISTAQAAKC